MYNEICAADYAAWKHRGIIADCASDMKLDRLARKIINSPANREKIAEFLTIIVKIANKHGNDDVIERLHCSGLIGQGGLI